MTRRRFYASPDQVDGSTVHLSSDETHHLADVLRLKSGDVVLVFDGCGREYRCEVIATGGKQARLEVVGTLDNQVESPLRLTLAQGIAKGEKFDFIIQKATELGVSRIVPLVTDYADVRLNADQAAKRLERWRRISLEALKQCGRRTLVEITAPMTLKQLLDTGTAGRGAVLVFSERGGAAITQALADAGSTLAVTAIIGPEGGWSDAELDFLNGRGVRAVTLGPRVLRTETAAVAAVTLIQHTLGDLSSPCET